MWCVARFGTISYHACNITKINTPPWVFFKFFKLYKWYQSRNASQLSFYIVAITTCLQKMVLFSLRFDLFILWRWLLEGVTQISLYFIKYRLELLISPYNTKSSFSFFSLWENSMPESKYSSKLVLNIRQDKMILLLGNFS